MLIIPAFPVVSKLRADALLSIKSQSCATLYDVMSPYNIGLAIVPTATANGIGTNLASIVVLVPGKNDIEANAKLEPNNVAAGL